MYENREPGDACGSMLDHLKAWQKSADEARGADNSSGSPELFAGDVDGDIPRAKRCLALIERAWPQADGSGDSMESVLPPGKVRETPRLAGRFEIIRQLGSGAHAIVYLAHDPALNRKVALKIPRPEVVPSSQMRRRFERESAAMANLAHPNLVPIFETGLMGPVCFIAQAYVEGPSLAEWLAERGPMPPVEAALLVACVATAVAYVHQHEIVHRDIKPANILLDTTARTPSSQSSDLRYMPKLTDFGLAKWLEDSPQLTRTLTAIGTPAYMAPEQIDGGAAAMGGAADIYGLGATLYEALTGQPPFRGRSTWDTFRQIKEGQLVPPGRLVRSLPPDLEAICMKCLEFEPRHRYRSATQLADDLYRFLNNEPVAARPASPLQRLAKWSCRRPLVASLLVILAVWTITGFSAIAWQWRDAERQRARAVTNFTLAHQGIRDVYNFLAEQPRLEHYEFSQLRRSLMQMVLDYYTQLREANSDNLHINRDIAEIGYNLAHASLAGGDNEVAVELCRELIPQWKRIAKSTPDQVDARYYLAQTQRILGISVARSGSPFEEAIIPIRESSAQLEELVEGHPSRPEFRSALADAYYAEASLERLSGNLNRSGQLTEAAVEQRRQAVQYTPDDSLLQQQMADGLNRLAAQYYVEGDYIRVEEYCSQAIALLENLFSDENQQPTIGVCLARSFRLYASAAEKLGKADLATRLNDRQAAILTRLSAMFPQEKQVQVALHVIHEGASGD